MPLSVEALASCGGDPAARRQAVASALAEARLRVRQGWEQGDPAVALLREMADGLDALLGELWRLAGAGSSPVSLIALGGWGRREVYPHSDLDLLFLHQGVEEPVTTRLVEEVIYPLWDAGLQVGHTVRQIDETIELAAEDLTVQTSLLDARLVAGAEEPLGELTRRAAAAFFGPERVNDFIARLLGARTPRHARFGESVFLLEPNVKSNKGGLRDVNTALWAARARYGVEDFAELPDHGAATARQARGLTEAHDFLRGLRLGMHLLADRAQDQLLFELQERLAPRLYPEAEIPGLRRRTKAAVAPAVERLMHAFYRHAKTVVVETEGLLERCGAPDADETVPAVRQLQPPFVAVGPYLSNPSPQVFWDEPAQLVKAFELAVDNALRLDRPTRDAMAEALAGEPGAQLSVDEEAAQRWLGLLCRDDLGDALSQMHDIGLVAAMVPEFEPCTGRVQHDMYHVYTVDRHTLYVVEFLRALRRGELREEHPRPTAVMAQVDDLCALYLGALLHDVAKPLGSGHAARGARLAAGVGARLGLPRDQQDTVCFLVREHLAMSHISQRRDLADPDVIDKFAARVGSAERLDSLYLLTVADTAMTRPGNLTEWKSALLDELHEYCGRRLQRGRRETVPPVAALIDDLVDEAVPRRGEAGRRLLERLPERFLRTRRSAADLERQLAQALSLDADPSQILRVATLEHRDTGTTELTVSCADAPGLLAMITGVLSALRIDVLAAQVYTLAPDDAGDGRGVALDIFTVRTPTSGDAQALWLRFREALEGVLKGVLKLSELTRGRSRGLPPRKLPPVNTVITFDEQGSSRFTIIDVHAPDRPGLLHALCSTLDSCGLEIELSMIATEHGGTVDSFYVRDRTSGGKIGDEGRRELVADRLRAAIAALEQQKEK